MLGITLTVIPSNFCIVVLAIGNLSSGDTVEKIVLLELPAMVLIGGLIGFGTGIILPNMWLVVVGTQTGWFGGLLALGIAQELFQNQLNNNLWSYMAYVVLIGCGILAGLSPALIARFLKGAR